MKRFALLPILFLSMMSSARAEDLQASDANQKGSAVMAFAKFLNGQKLQCKDSNGETRMILSANLTKDKNSVDVVVESNDITAVDLVFEHTKSFFVLSEEPNPPMSVFYLIPKSMTGESLQKDDVMDITMTVTKVGTWDIEDLKKLKCLVR